jgi:hypothetical protein
VTDRKDPFFLFIGSMGPDTATSSLKASGIHYKWKRLESLPHNWKQIIEYLQDPVLIGVVVKLTSQNYESMVATKYASAALDIIESLGKVRHIVFVHESVLRGIDERPKLPDDPDHYMYLEYITSPFRPPEEEARLQVNRLLDEYEINIVPYRTNAEMSVLALAFINENEKNLLFRVYIPSGRLWAAEADRLLSLFRDWLSEAKHQRVRQDGYRTRQGQVYEFFGEESLTPDELSHEFADFSRFLDLCLARPEDATRVLVRSGLNQGAANSLVERYAKDVRRLNVDVKHERERRMLSIRHRLESEILEALNEQSPEWTSLGELLEVFVPQAPTRSLVLAPGPVKAETPPQSVTVNINQQFVETVHGAVMQDVQGDLTLGPQALELLRLIDQFGGPQTGALRSDVHELEDPDARSTDRLAAKQRLKGFLIKISERAEGVAVALLQKYLENKLGLSPSAGQ